MSAQTEALKRRLAAIPKAVKDAVKPALLQSGEELADRMKALVPVDHGALRDSIIVTPPGGTTPDGAKTARENQVFVTADAGHATHVEYGHHTPSGSHVPAEPFFWPAYRLSKSREINRINRAITKAVREAWDK